LRFKCPETIQKILKKANTHLVLNCIISEESITIEDVVKKTKLSRPTVVNIIKDLTERDIVVKSGFAEYTGGRLPTLLSLNANSYYAIGIDFEYPPIRMAISNLKGEVVRQRNLTVDRGYSRNRIIEEMFEELEGLIRESEIPMDRFIGIGIGLLGYLKAQQGISLQIWRIPEWKDVDFKKLVKERFGLPVYMQNDIHMMALAEKRLFLSDRNDDFAYVGIRPGIRAGIGLAMHINGSFYGGVNGNAHLLGHMTIDINGEPCPCGSKGCLELMAENPKSSRDTRRRSAIAPIRSRSAAFGTSTRARSKERPSPPKCWTTWAVIWASASPTWSSCSA